MIKTLYNIDTTGRLREWSVEVQDNRYRFISGLVDGQKVTSAWSVAEGKNQGRANATTDAEQAERIAETYIRIRKELGYAEDVKDAGKGKAYFQPMLAARWADVKDKVLVDETHSVFVQRKLDGCVSGDMLISTDSGIVTMKDVVENGKGTRVVSFNEKTGKQELKGIIGRFKNGTDIQLENKPVWYKITLANGTVLKLTGNHRVYLPKLRCWRRVDQLTTEDFLQLQR